MKKNIWLLFLAFSPLSHAQNWVSVGGGVSNDVRGLYVDTSENLLYIVGTFQEAGGNPAGRVAAWDGQNWTSLCDLNDFWDQSPIHDVIKYNNELIVSGSQYYMGNVITGGLAKLTTNGWQSFNDNIDGAMLMTVIDDELYAFCCFDEIDGQPIKDMAKWNGVYWDSIGTQSEWTIPNLNAQISNIVKYNNNLIAAGNFENGNLKEIAQWDGTAWLSLQNGVVGEAYLFDAIVYKGILYVAGEFVKSQTGNPANDVMAWNGETWFNPFPDVDFTFQVSDLEVINDELYIVGEYKFLGDNKKYTFAKYDGENFCAFGGSYNLNQHEDPFKIAGFNDEIYVSCNRVLFGDTVNYIAKWTGTEMDSCVYSPITVAVKELPKPETNYQVSPNPATNEVQIKWNSIFPGAQVFYLYDQFGKVIQEQKYISHSGENVIELEISELSKGVYILDTGLKKIKVIKQ